MTSTAASETRDKLLVRGIVERAFNDIEMLTDHELKTSAIRCERVNERVTASGCIHISFRIEFGINGASPHGCLLIPLPEAIAIACYLTMMPDDSVESHRKDTDLTRTMKDAMLEISNFIGGAADQFLRGWEGDNGFSARSAGCQGVADGAIPNLAYSKGDELILAHIETKVHEFDTFDAILIVPAALANQ